MLACLLSCSRQLLSAHSGSCPLQRLLLSASSTPAVYACCRCCVHLQQMSAPCVSLDVFPATLRKRAQTICAHLSRVECTLQHSNCSCMCDLHLTLLAATDGAYPHFLTILFQRKMTLSEISFFLNFTLDEVRFLHAGGTMH